MNSLLLCPIFHLHPYYSVSHSIVYVILSIISEFTCEISLMSHSIFISHISLSMKAVLMTLFHEKVPELYYLYTSNPLFHNIANWLHPIQWRIYPLAKSAMAPFGQKNLFDIVKKLENLVLPLPLCVSTSGQQTFGPSFLKS